jgi:hypothetical protein
MVDTYSALGSMMLKNFMPNISSKWGPAFILVMHSLWLYKPAALIGHTDHQQMTI